MSDQPFGAGGIPRKEDKRDFQLGMYQVGMLPTEILPASFSVDMSEVPVKYQGKWGTCGAHAGSALDSAVFSRDLSPKYLWKEIKLIDGYTYDQGTDMRSIFKTLADRGDCLESLMPNDLQDTVEAYSDPAIVTDNANFRIDASKQKLGAYAFANAPLTFADIKRYIYNHGACIALVDISDAWWNPSWKKEDILPLRMTNLVGHHFVVLYGYDEKYVYFRNSWGTAWGDNGNGYFDESYAPHVLEIGSAVKVSTSYLFKNDLRMGMVNNDVKELQKRLGVTPTSGFFGIKTFLAVRAFQKANGLPVTGFVGVLTRAKLNLTTN